MTKKFQKISAAAACAATLLLTGCATGPQKFAVSDHTIRSILVVPAVNETTSVDADNLMNAMSTYTLAEGGYYVFPMDTVKYVLEAEGLYEPERKSLPNSLIRIRFSSSKSCIGTRRTPS